MAIRQSDLGLDAVDWAAALAEPESFDAQPSEDDLRAAMLDMVTVFNQGHLTEDELKWVLSLLAAQMATQAVEREFREVLSDFGRGFDEEPSFTRYDFRPRITSPITRFPYA